MSLEYLEGKNVTEFIEEVPELKWNLMDGGRVRYEDVNIEKLQFVFYPTEYPKERVEKFEIKDLREGISEEDIEGIKGLYENMSPRNIGLCSKVGYEDPLKKDSCEMEYDNNVIGYDRGTYAHIPMIDFDLDKKDKDVFDDWTEEEITDMLIEKAREKPELDKGIILESSPGNNYHLIGIGKLLPKEDFMTFIGLAGDMRYEQEDGGYTVLPDTLHLSHSIAPQSDHAKVANRMEDKNWSKYDYKERFAALRIAPKALFEESEDPPEIIRVFE